MYLSGGEVPRDGIVVPSPDARRPRSRTVLKLPLRRRSSRTCATRWIAPLSAPPGSTHLPFSNFPLLGAAPSRVPLGDSRKAPQRALFLAAGRPRVSRTDGDTASVHRNGHWHCLQRSRAATLNARRLVGFPVRSACSITLSARFGGNSLRAFHFWHDPGLRGDGRAVRYEALIVPFRSKVRFST